jgi:hypothetical protein
MNGVHQGEIIEMIGEWAPPGGRNIDLVFRTVEERTSDLALTLALKNIRPNRVFVLKNIKPFAFAVRKMLTLPHACSHVVHMDADCLILEDMRPFLDHNDKPYVDCYVRDRFRGRIHCGVHITSLEVVKRMAEIPPPDDDLAFVLRPESRLRNLALASLGAEKQLKTFHILHDHFQRYEDIFSKYALRELRSRDEHHKKRLEGAMGKWLPGPDTDVATHAVRHAARVVPADAKPKDVDAYIRNLPYIAQVEIEKMGLTQTGQLGMEEVEAAVTADPTNLGPTKNKPKVFGLGLSRTGTRSLSAALHVLGYDTLHYPTDQQTLDTLIRGDAKFPQLDHFDGLTDITVSPYFEDLDANYPGSKFILTVREEEGWLKSCKNHWSGRDAFEKAPKEGKDVSVEEHQIHMEIRRFLRAAVYAGYDYQPERFARTYRRHVDDVQRYFADRPQDLLVLNIASGEGYEKLAPFLGVAVPPSPFPHKGKRLSERMAEKMGNLEVDD